MKHNFKKKEEQVQNPKARMCLTGNNMEEPGSQLSRVNNNRDSYYL